MFQVARQPWLPPPTSLVCWSPRVRDPRAHGPIGEQGRLLSVSCHLPSQATRRYRAGAIRCSVWQKKVVSVQIENLSRPENL